MAQTIALERIISCSVFRFHEDGLIFRFHELRHSCASLLLSQGIAMKQIQDWLGHSTFATTADIYSHLDFNSKQESAEAISAAFAPSASPGEPEENEEPEEDAPGFGMSMSM